MKKRTFGRFSGLICLLLILSLGGCADTEILQEILHTVVTELDVEKESTEENQEKDAGRMPAEESVQELLQNSGKTENEVDFLYEGASCFAYRSLNETEQIWYRDIAGCLGKMQEDIRLDKEGLAQGMNETNIDKIFQCVLMDHPELFYVEGYTYTKYNRGERIITIEFSGTYSMDSKQAQYRKEEIDQEVQLLLDGGAGFATDYDKIKYVYETIIRNTEYDLDAPENQNIYSVFVNHKSVCQGYAKAVQYLLERMGVECALVQGTVDTGEGHAWNLVKSDGSYYYVDATWGDASYQSEGEDTDGQYVPEINYDYLCVTTKQLLRTHILDSYVAMPACVEEKDNYYVREGALFTAYDKEQMRALFEKAAAENRTDITVKCTDTECFRQILTAMIDDQEIFDYLRDGSDSVAYTHNEKQLSMTFWVTNE